MPSQIHMMMRLFSYVKKLRIEMLIASIYSMLITFLDILPDFLIGITVDVIVYRKHSMLADWGITTSYHQLVALGLMAAAIWILQSVFEYLCSVKWRLLAQSLQHAFRLDVYKHMQKVDMVYFENVSSGQLVSILNDDINQLERFFDNGINMLIHIMTSIVLIGIFFFVLATKLAMLAFLPIPLILWGAYYFQRLIRPQYENVREKAGELNTRFTNNMMGIATIKSYTAEKYELHSLKKQSLSYQKANTIAIHLTSMITPIIRMSILFGFLTTLIYGGWLTLHGDLAVSVYSILIILSQRLLWPLTYLAEVLDQFYRAMASINRILNLFNAPINMRSGALPKAMQIQGEIVFENVTFQYSKNKEALIKQLNLIIPAGKTIGLVGSTGAGKSTLIKLLLRFYDPTEGRIILDGNPLKEYDLESLRKEIGYVSQDVFLFNGTIAENIAYGTFNATLAQIKKAAKYAEAHDFIMQMPKHYETRIGDRGIKLSGGQKQRLSIARALLKNPTIFILDEATSALDNETELAIKKSIREIVKGRTTIIIAHRLNTICEAQAIYVFEKGVIIEEGDHRSLMAAKGKYATLWQLQMGVI